MYKYVKIPAVFKRDTEGKREIIQGEYIDETVDMLKNVNWLCTEKVDGTNIGVVWDGHKVSFQGRTERAQIPAPLVNKLNELFGGDETEELFEQTFGEKQFILFGEGYGGRIQAAGPAYGDVSFILFDVYMPEANVWLTRESIEEIAKTFGVQAVPVIMTGTLEEAVEYVRTKPQSTLGDIQMEGLVCHPVHELRYRSGNRVIVKVKVNDVCPKE